MPPELLRILTEIKNALVTPRGAAGSGSAEAYEELQDAIQQLSDVLSGEGGASNLYERRANRIEFDDLSTQIGKVIARSNRLYAADQYMASHNIGNVSAAERIMQIRKPFALREIDYRAQYGDEDYKKVLRVEFSDFMKRERNELLDPWANKEDEIAANYGRRRATNWGRKQREMLAEDYILSKGDPRKYRDIVGQRQWGEQWSRVKAAEDEAAKRERDKREKSSIISHFIGKSPVAQTTAIAYGVSKLIKEIGIATSRFNEFAKSMYRVNKLVSVSAGVAGSYMASGLDPISAYKASMGETIWGAGLKFGIGAERLQRLAMGGVDVSGIDPLTATAKSIMDAIAPQVQAMSKEQQQNLLALGALTPEQLLAYNMYGKEYKDYSREEQVMAQRSEYELSKEKFRQSSFWGAIDARLMDFAEFFLGKDIMMRLTNSAEHIEEKQKYEKDMEFLSNLTFPSASYDSTTLGIAPTSSTSNTVNNVNNDNQKTFNITVSSGDSAESIADAIVIAIQNNEEK